MAPAASLPSAAAAAAAAGAKRPASSDAEPLDSSSAPPQGGAAGKSQPQQQLECPRCGSSNTKFCYYNNYSTAQPRHFCRACRRYWTKGGTLRDVPVGGASRRSAANKRRRLSGESSSASPPAATSSSERAEDACTDLPAFPFLTGGIFLPQLDLGGVAPQAFSWPSAAPDLHINELAPWDDGARGGVGVAGAWDSFGDIVGLSWPPPPAGN